VLRVARANDRERNDDGVRLSELTEREHDVLRCMARGLTNPEIATALIVGEATVKSHVSAIFAKLGVRDRAAAIVFAYDHGVVDPRLQGDAT
jgi:DNA-binding NarL/FixJ family response regulator